MLLQNKNLSPSRLTIYRCINFSKKNSTGTLPCRRSKEWAFRQIQLTQFPENKTLINPFWWFISKCTTFPRTLLSRKIPVQPKAGSRKRPPRVTATQAALLPATQRLKARHNSIIRTWKSKRQLRTTAGAPLRSNRQAPHGAARRPAPPDPVPCGPCLPPPHGGQRRPGRRGSTLARRRPWLRSRASAWASPARRVPRPWASASPREGPGPGQASLSPSRGLLPCVGLGAGRREGVGANKPSGSGGRSSSSRRKLSATIRRLGLKRKNSVGGEGGGEESRALEGGKDRDGQVSREIQTLARVRSTHVTLRAL